MNKPRMTELQARVLAVIGPEWSTREEVAMRCMWGEEGCRRDLTQLTRTMQELCWHGQIERNHDAAGDVEVRRVKA